MSDTTLHPVRPVSPLTSSETFSITECDARFSFSDEEDELEREKEKYNVASVENKIFDGQEKATIDFDGDIKITAFNMEEEMQDGHFDKEGTFIFKKDKEMVKDSWLDNIDWVRSRNFPPAEKSDVAVADVPPQPRHSPLFDKRLSNHGSQAILLIRIIPRVIRFQVKIKENEQKKNEKNTKGLADSSDSEDEETRNKLDIKDLYSKMLEMMKPGENILKCIKRLGGGNTNRNKRFVAPEETK